MVTEQSHTEELYSTRNRNDPLFSEPGMGVLPGMGILRKSKRDTVLERKMILTFWWNIWLEILIRN